MKHLRDHGRLKAISGVICAEDGEHLGSMYTRGSFDVSQCWDGPARARELVHWHYYGPRLGEALSTALYEIEQAKICGGLPAIEEAKKLLIEALV